MRTAAMWILVLALLTGCAQADNDSVSGATGSGEILCSEEGTIPPPECLPPDAGEPELVTPRPGMADVRPIPWERAEPVGDARLRVHWTGGVEPCYVLDRVEVTETAETVTVTLFQGSDPTAPPDQACIEIGVFKAVEVDLEAPLGDRTVVDGAL